MRDRQHCSGTERVTDHGGGGGNGQRQHAREQPVHPIDVPRSPVGVGAEPVQIQPVGVELSAGGGDQPQGAVRDDLIERGLNVVQKCWGETVLIVAQPDDGDLVVVIQFYSHVFP